MFTLQNWWTRDNEFKFSSLHLAIENNKPTDTIETIIKQDPNLLEKRDILGRTPLFLATLEEKNNIIKLLNKYNANVNTTNNYGSTPLVYAIQFANIETIKLLLKNQTAKAEKINHASQSKMTPISAALERIRDNKSAIIIELLKAGFEPANRQEENLLLDFCKTNPKLKSYEKKLLLKACIDESRAQSSPNNASHENTSDWVKVDFDLTTKTENEWELVKINFNEINVEQSEKTKQPDLLLE